MAANPHRKVQRHKVFSCAGRKGANWVGAGVCCAETGARSGSGAATGVCTG